MKSNERTLTNLLNLDRRVYLYFANAAVWDIFVRQATAEGFLWSGKTKIPKKQRDDIIAMNNDMTFNYIGWAGHMRFGCSDDGIYRIDFAKYINGAEDYSYRKKSVTLSGTEQFFH